MQKNKNNFNYQRFYTIFLNIFFIFPSPKVPEGQNFINRVRSARASQTQLPPSRRDGISLPQIIHEVCILYDDTPFIINIYICNFKLRINNPAQRDL